MGYTKKRNYRKTKNTKLGNRRKRYLKKNKTRRKRYGGEGEIKECADLCDSTYGFTNINDPRRNRCITVCEKNRMAGIGWDSGQ
tara:strand:- start:535 stop:786 length:252 start_codon:yes stop_codon:yes gene_type:complete